MGCLQSRNIKDDKETFLSNINKNNNMVAVNKPKEPATQNNQDTKPSLEVVTPQKIQSPDTGTKNSLQTNSFRGSLKPKGSITNPDDFRLQLNDLVQEKQEKIGSVYNLLMPAIGKGTFGEVRKAIHKKTGLVRAVKMILKASQTEEAKKNLLNEVDILRSLDHPNIIKVYEFFQDEKYFYIVSDLCNGGELFDKIVEVKFFGEKQASDIIAQVLSAVAYCHSHNIVHRDLKPENLLLESSKENALIKVIDFGTSRFFDPKIKMNQKFGTLLYMAPEVFTGRYNEKCDVWSCGVILYILLCGYPPFNARSDTKVIEKVKSGAFSFPEEDWGTVSDEAKILIGKMLERDPTKRLTAEQALNDAWIKNRSSNTIVDQPVALKAMKNLKSFRSDRKLQQATWVFLVSNIATREEKNEMLNTFKALDLNGDGQLTRDELLIGYRKIMGDAEAEAEVENIMTTVDTNNSGTIDYSEFVTATINRQKLLSEERLKIAFEMFDKDQSGSISIPELKEMFGGAFEEIASEVWDQLIKEVDVNGDGEISLTEFKEMMLKLSNE